MFFLELAYIIFFKEWLIKMKRAEISTSFLVKFIILIVGFGILFYAIYTMFFSDSIMDRTACHQSVVLRGTLPDSFWLSELKKIPNLQCETKKLCITDKTIGDDCSYSGKAGKDYYVQRVSGDRNKKEESINRIVSREIAECWSMMGEGKLQIFTREVTKKNSCVICTQVEFGENLKKDFQTINGIAKYMFEHKVPGKEISYYEFLYGKNNPEIYNSKEDFLTTNKKSIVFYEKSTDNIGTIVYTALFSSMSTAVGAKTGALIGSVVIPIPVVGTVAGGIIGAGFGAGFGLVVGSKFGTEFDEALRGYKPKYFSQQGVQTYS